MIDTGVNKYEVALELSKFLSEFCDNVQMYASIEIICSEQILTLIPISTNSPSGVGVNVLVEMLRKNNIIFLRYQSAFSVPSYYNYFKVGEKDLVSLNITSNDTFVKYLRKVKLKFIFYE
jgi:hypothetical protein